MKIVPVILKSIFRSIIFIILTILTQIGGIVFLISLMLTRKTSKIKRLGVFIGLYLISIFFIVPNIAPMFGREKITDNKFVEAHSIFYKLSNRNYVRPELNTSITNIGEKLYNRHRIKLTYLDANFPFINNFPLLPHLSHNDGKKVDISLIYEKNGRISQRKPSVSGYGFFENPKKNAVDYCKICKSKGFWKYDLTKYVTFGTINKDIKFSNKGTSDLVKMIVQDKFVGKLLIEPHLKNRLHLNNRKVRFQGCHAVRHDDHIHFQLK